MSKQNTMGTLLHLWRFYIAHDPIYLQWLRRVSNHLEAQPNQMRELVTLRKELVSKQPFMSKKYEDYCSRSLKGE